MTIVTSGMGKKGGLALGEMKLTPLKPLKNLFCH
jgi:hypothetical protein